MQPWRHSGHLVRFGPFEVDLNEQVLRKHDIRVRLQSQPFRILAALLEQPGRVVTREELRRLIWRENTFVDFEHGLNAAVTRLRQALGDSSDNPRYIETLPKRGYRFSGKVEKDSEIAGEAPTGTPPPASTRQAGVRIGKRIWILAATATLLAACGTVLWLTSPNRHAPIRLTPFTSFLGDENQPAISRDGNLVAFVCRDPEPKLQNWGPPYKTSDICVKAVGTDSVRRLTETPETEIHPAWSPSGNEIVFVRGDAGIFVISNLGGHERKVSGSGTHPSWTPDGKSILVRDRTEARSWAIYSIELDTLERRQLTFPPAGLGEWDFDISPDGRTLAFIRFEQASVGDIYTVSMQAGEPRRMTDWNARVESVTWTPDGRELIYAIGGRLWRMPGKGSGIGRGVPLPDIPMQATQASISMSDRRQGGRLVFRTMLQERGMRLIELGARLPIQAAPPISPASRNSVPGAFSPDGSRIAFTSDRTSAGPNLWVVNRDGSGARQITFLDTPAMGIPSWSPDGTRLALDAFVEGNTDVYVISTDGGKPLRLTSGLSIDETSEWSPDGNWIYFSSTAKGQRPEVWKVRAEGGTPEQVTHGGGYQPKVSPDGEHLYYLDSPPHTGGSPIETARLFRMPIRGGKAALIHERIPPYYWSVSSRGIFFVAGDRSPTSELCRLDKGKVIPMGTLPFMVAVTPGGMAVSRDGRWALVSAVQRNEGDLMLLENFR